MNATKIINMFRMYHPPPQPALAPAPHVLPVKTTPRPMLHTLYIYAIKDLQF